MSIILSIDIGTSSAKALLLEAESAQVLGTASHEYGVDKPTADRAEQDPDSWWDAVAVIVPQVMAQTGTLPDAVIAIGLTGQMHGTVMLDEAHKPVHPAIIWADQRSRGAVEALIDQFGTDDYAQLTGTLPATGFMVSTLLWIAQNKADLLDATHHIVLPKDYVRLKLTGNIATDISDAASTGMFDVSHGNWAQSITDFVGVDVTKLPSVLESTQIAGRLTQRASQTLGLAVGIPVIAGCADQPAQALTNGLVGTGIASVTIGTGGQVFVPLMRKNGDDPIPTDPRLHVFNHALPDQWYVLGAILSAGASLKWLRNVTGLASNPNAYAILSAEASRVAVGSDGLIFLPYLSGERTPHMDSMARGAFIGLSDYHGRGHLARAVMEGVIFALKQTLDISVSLAGDIDQLIIAGGGAESALWRQIQADIFGLSLQKSTQPEQTSTGVALLAGLGVGVYRSYEDASARIQRPDGAISAHIAENHARYMSLFDQFNHLYPHLKDDFHKLTAFGLQYR